MSLVQDGTFQGSSGDFVCRSPKWTDVVKFFLLNYGLHAVTVINIPGAGTEGMAFNILAALICPMIGITSAAGAILSRSMLAKEKLVRAQRARALCMLVPWELNEKLGYAAIDMDLAREDKNLCSTDIGSGVIVDRHSGGKEF